MMGAPMIVPPLALVLGAPVGYLLRARPRAVGYVAIATPALSVLAMLAQLVPGGGMECVSTVAGSSTCQAVPAIAMWSGPLPYAIAAELVVLSLAPLLSVRLRSWWPAGASAVLQAVPQLISFGGFVAWAPALLATTIVAFAFAFSRGSERLAAR